MTLISVIVPVYNMEKYLDRCVQSIRKQTYQELEIILVDDGSSDRSPQMCDAYAEQDSRIKVVHKKNGGLSDARNAGLAAATGDYIGYVDSDDWIAPEMYEKMLGACMQNQAQIAICRYAEVHGNSINQCGSGRQTVFERDQLIRIYVAGSDDYMIYNSVWSKLFARKLVENEVFPVGRNSEDIMYTTKAFCKVEKAVYLDESFYFYVVDREDSIMNGNQGERLFRDEIPFWKEHINYITEHISKELGDLAAFYFYRRMLYYYERLKSSECTSAYAYQLLVLLREDKEKIKRVCGECSVRPGDRYRLKLFIFSPQLYDIMNNLYNNCIVRIKKRRNKGSN